GHHAGPQHASAAATSTPRRSGEAAHSQRQALGRHAEGDAGSAGAAGAIDAGEVISFRHGRAWPGHPRLDAARKSWMPGSSPGMTTEFVATTRPLHRPLVAREHALHRPRPAFQFPLTRGGAHVRLEAVLEAPVVGEF